MASVVLLVILFAIPTKMFISNGTENSSIESNATDTTVELYTIIPNNTEEDNIKQNTTINITQLAKNVSEVPQKSVDRLQEPCSCDQSYETCDVDCCCDPDCTLKDVETFGKCAEKASELPRGNSWCFGEDAVFTNNAPYVWDRIKSGLLCVHFDNFQERFNYEEIRAADTEAEFAALSSRTSSVWHWPNVAEPKLPISDGMLKSGHPLFTVSNEGMVDYFVQPKPFINGLCSHTAPSKYLLDESHTCSEPINNLESDCLSNPRLRSSSYFDGFRILRTNPTDVNSSVEVIPIGCGVSEFSEALSKLLPCDKTLIAEELPPEPTFSDFKCMNAVESVEYVIVHNGTEGIVSVEAKIRVGDIAAGSDLWKQNFATRFRWNSDPLDGPRRRSGNPGYVIGKPILAGKLVTNRTKEGVLVTSDPSNMLTVPLMNSAGHCLQPTQRRPVLFGEDILTGCFLPFGPDIDCWTVREMALELLLGPDPPNLVGCYGDSDPSDVTQWVPVLFSDSVRQEGAGSCAGFVGHLSWVVDFAKVGSVTKPQSKVVGVRRVLSDPVDVPRSGQGAFLTVSVTFVDVSRSAVATYAEPPSLDLHFPADFFYPFFSSAERGVSQWGTVWITILALLHLAVTFWM